MTQTLFDRLVAFLKEIFRLDKPDLDFGFYRVMHAKADEVTQFLEHDLLPRVKEAFSGYESRPGGDEPDGIERDNAVLNGWVHGLRVRWRECPLRRGVRQRRPQP